jgi:hypothetical protein
LTVIAALIGPAQASAVANASAVFTLIFIALLP